MRAIALPWPTAQLHTTTVVRWYTSTLVLVDTQQSLLKMSFSVEFGICVDLGVQVRKESPKPVASRSLNGERFHRFGVRSFLKSAWGSITQHHVSNPIDKDYLAVSRSNEMVVDAIYTRGSRSSSSSGCAGHSGDSVVVAALCRWPVTCNADGDGSGVFLFHFFRLSWDTSTFEHYHPEDSRYSESRRIELSSKSTTSLR